MENVTIDSNITMPPEAKATEANDVPEQVTTKAHDEIAAEAQSLAMPEVNLNSQVQQDEEVPKSWFDKILSDSTRANMIISVVNALLHLVASVTSIESVNNGPVMKWFNEKADTAAFFCTKYLAPFCSYGLSVIDSLRKGRLIQAFIKFLPPSLLPTVGNANIDTVYGSSTGLNAPYNMVEERIKFKSTHDSEFKKYAIESNKTMLGNAKMIWAEFKELCKDFVSGKLSTEYSLLMTNCPLNLLGSIPILLFGRHDRDTLLAKVTGLIRNTGGMLGDFTYGFYGKEPYKKLVGGFCSLAAIADIAKRWTKNETLAKLLIHLGAALNVSAYAVWNAFDSSDKDSTAHCKAAEIKDYQPPPFSKTALNQANLLAA